MKTTTTMSLTQFAQRTGQTRQAVHGRIRRKTLKERHYKVGNAWVIEVTEENHGSNLYRKGNGR